MAINIPTTNAAIVTALSQAMFNEFGTGSTVLADYIPFATVIADAVGDIILQVMKDDADLVGVTSGPDTVGGGVN